MSEFEEYKKLGEPDKREKSEIWETAIGLQQNNKITANEISVKLGKSLATIKRKIKDLKDRKVIERIGSDKTGSWKILKADEE